MKKELAYLNALRCVEVAARHQSYSKAAEELHVTQAAVSQQIRLIESVLDTKLFQRKGHMMQPTLKGKTLAEHLNKGFEIISQGIKKLSLEPLEGPLNVTTTHSFAMFLIPHIWNFYRTYPNIEVKIFVSSELEDLHHGEMDIAIRFGFGSWAGLNHTILLEDDLVTMCSPNLLEHVDLSDPKNIKKCSLVGPNNREDPEWLEWLSAAGIQEEPDNFIWLQVPHNDLAMSAVLAGHGMFLGSALLARSFLESGRLIQPFEISLKNRVRYNLLHAPNSSRIKRIAVFKSWLESLF